MAITKEAEIKKIEVVGDYKTVQVATDTVIKEDEIEISRSRHRHVLVPYKSKKDGDTWTHTDTDISGEATEVQAVANAVWTDTVKANYKTFIEDQKEI
tara:strand:+ start:244 stop:537 length:294 start_codon:yes stop_codon:yes gene_type:complete